MIPLQRIRSAETVHPNFFGSKRIALNKLLIQKKLAGELEGGGDSKWDSGIWKPAKKQLLAETYNKCAYCETPTRVVAYGDVEHFRPKSKYWWLAYCYENYLAACTACNQEYKKDKFDLRDDALALIGPAISLAAIEEIAKVLTPDAVDNTAGRDITLFETELLNEWAKIVQPYLEDPAEYYAYEADIEEKVVYVTPARPEYADVIEASEDIFGINRKELIELRFQWYCLYMTFRRTYEVPGLPADIRQDNGNRLQEMQDDWSPYAGMIRYFHSKPLSSLPWDSNIRITAADLVRPKRKRRTNS